MLLTLRRAALVAALVVAAGVFAQVSGLVAVAAGALGVPPERIGFDAGSLLTPRKLATAMAFALVAAVTWGLLRRDSGARLLDGIPPMSAAGAGAFRIALAAALLWALGDMGPIEPGLAPELHRHPGALANWSWAEALAAHESATLWLHGALVTAVIVFGLGLVTRAATAMVAMLAATSAIVLLQRQSSHDWGLPVVALCLLTLAPLGDALSVDALVRRWRRRPPPVRTAQEYGLAVWMPGLALGIALLAAAFAKIDTSGPAWITSGAVRYHFIEDARHAPTDWGLRIAASDAGSMLTALGAVVAEAIVILHVFYRSWRVRTAAGVLAAALLAGFFLLQGVAWRLWWVLLVAFVPWEPIVASVRRGVPRPAPAAAPSLLALRRWQIAIVAAFVLQQVVFSSVHLELEPFASDYGMYAFTWPSRDAFEAHLVRKLRTVRVEETPAGTRVITEEPVFDWSRGRFGPPRITVEEVPADPHR
ncbi:MAG: hypothetical protein ACRD26_24705 [Vicinamibacterales bacterium]